MRRAVSGLGLIVAPYTLSMRVHIAVQLNFRLAIGAGNKPRNGNVAGHEVPEPCLVRALVCMNEDCHRKMRLPFLVGAGRRGRTRGRLALQTLANESTPAVPIA